MGKKPNWSRFRSANNDYCQFVISDGLPTGVTISVEHNFQFCRGAPIVNRLGRRIVQWLREHDADNRGFIRGDKQHRGGR